MDAAQILSHLDDRLARQDETRKGEFESLHRKLDVVIREQSSQGTKLEMHMKHDDERFNAHSGKFKSIESKETDASKERGNWLRTLITIVFSSVSAFFLSRFMGKD